MAKLNLDAYNFIDLSQTDFSLLTDEELAVYIKDTIAVLDAYKKKATKAKMIFGLAAGLLAMRGGELTKVTLFSKKYKKGNATKQELKLVKRVIKTFRIYLVFKVVIALVGNQQAGMQLLAPHAARKK
ncbi:MAG: hypothetical protein K2L87_03825 [Clostridiales bacterium]|nr:hypothetical protein [Clostridiales bacterium]